MSLGTTAAVLIGAGIGAGGSVAAQITASVFSGRRDVKRLEWERSKLEHDDQHRSQERFLDLKRELYGRFLSIANAYLMFAEDLKIDPASVPPYPLPTRDQIADLIGQIEIISDTESLSRDLANRATTFYNAPHKIKAADPDERESRAGEVVKTVFTIRKLLRADLLRDMSGPTELAQASSPARQPDA